MASQLQVCTALIDYGKKLAKLKIDDSKVFTPDKKANALLLSNPFAYVVAVIADQGIRAEKAWEIPYRLKERLGCFGVAEYASMPDSKIIAAFEKAPKLHRFNKQMALRMKKAAQLIIDKYNGKAENIWNDCPKSSELHNRFDEFEGIGQKKASMAVNILAKDFGIALKDKTGIDISYDIHIRRVMLRSGLASSDTMESIVSSARALNPSYPGILDGPCWRIGREYCHPTNPDCGRCPIGGVCSAKYKLKYVKNPLNDK